MLANHSRNPKCISIPLCSSLPSNLNFCYNSTSDCLGLNQCKSFRDIQISNCENISNNIDRIIPSESTNIFSNICNSPKIKCCLRNSALNFDKIGGQYNPYHIKKKK